MDEKSFSSLANREQVPCVTCTASGLWTGDLSTITGEGVESTDTTVGEEESTAAAKGKEVSSTSIAAGKMPHFLNELPTAGEISRM